MKKILAILFFIIPFFLFGQKIENTILKDENSVFTITNYS